MNKKAREYIDKLQLKPHPEGGFYKEVYRAGEIILSDHLPDRYKTSRTFSTSIYYLLEGNQVSKFHRLKSDEQWHFYDGSTLIIYVIDEGGKLKINLLGKDSQAGESYQVTILRNSWFGAELLDKSLFSLIGCTVSPGFDYGDFELGKRKNLLEDYPEFEDIILKLTNR
jgi:predicted cupin superfamily sugar epimerase